MEDMTEKYQKDFNLLEKILFFIVGIVALLVQIFGTYLILFLLYLLMGHGIIFLIIGLGYLSLELYRHIKMKKKGYQVTLGQYLK